MVPVFVTVDPERDTVAALAAYAPSFHPDLVALTGTPGEIAAAAKAYRVYYAKAEDTSSETYLMDHSSFIYLMGPDGAYRTHFSHLAQSEEIADGVVETWRYDPHVLSDSPVVDVLSLYAQFWDHRDERVAYAASELLEAIDW